MFVFLFLWFCTLMIHSKVFFFRLITNFSMWTMFVNHYHSWKIQQWWILKNLIMLMIRIKSISWDLLSFKNINCFSNKITIKIIFLNNNFHFPFSINTLNKVNVKSKYETISLCLISFVIKKLVSFLWKILYYTNINLKILVQSRVLDFSFCLMNFNYIANINISINPKLHSIYILLCPNNKWWRSWNFIIYFQVYVLSEMLGKIKCLNLEKLLIILFIEKKIFFCFKSKNKNHF
jgi:hypothetical protein